MGVMERKTETTIEWVLGSVFSGDEDWFFAADYDATRTRFTYLKARESSS